MGIAAWEEANQGEAGGTRESGIHLRTNAPGQAEPGAAGDDALGLGALLDCYDASGYGVSVGAACSIGVQLCDALHRLHKASEAAGALRAHGRVSFGTVCLSRSGELTLLGVGQSRPDPRARATDVRDAALLVTELLGGRAAAQKLLPRALGAVVERAIAGTVPGDRPVRAADLARALSTEAATPSELHVELRLVWPRLSTPLRLPPPPRVPVITPVKPLSPVAWEPADEWESEAPATLPARPSAVRR